ncbi:hypothetical protein ADIMK_1919 [Marinobacterium lacunae]|uniref:Uncharacterized protein n=1 Tax=Marinobacterium lacunae TaxID=1232683 RepID=A0A081FZE7_9GAMM|nr:hypothetical protein [Marinobacterium lacunae]KEA63902.1 hypothetical protein ADIMK_1919 [Marinobacterium lacunae]
MTIRSLAEASARLEEAVMNASIVIETPTDLYDLYEMTAIQILDSNFDAFPDGVLEGHLRSILEEKAIQLLGSIQ